MESTLENKKLELIQWLSTLNDASVIDKIFLLRQSERNDWWEKISDNEKECIEKGLKDAEEGHLKPHSEARKMYGKWL